MVKGNIDPTRSPHGHPLNDLVCATVRWMAVFAGDQIEPDRKGPVTDTHLSLKPVGQVCRPITCPAKIVADRFVKVGRNLPGVDRQIHVDGTDVTGARHQERRNPAADQDQVPTMPAEHGERFDKYRLARRDGIIIVVVERHHVGMISRLRISWAASSPRPGCFRRSR